MVLRTIFIKEKQHICIISTKPNLLGGMDSHFSQSLVIWYWCWTLLFWTTFYKFITLQMLSLCHLLIFNSLILVLLHLQLISIMVMIIFFTNFLLSFNIEKPFLLRVIFLIIIYIFMQFLIPKSSYPLNLSTYPRTVRWEYFFG